ncbi:hypothetical protein G9A89_020840 [Geosiphon pyriformis]|nr:hypothetical protein G9A89_020840 [Geosiphon pyriformis]
MDSASLSAGGSSLVLAGLGFWSSISIKKKTRVESVYSCGSAFKKTKKPGVFDVVVDLLAGPLSADMLQANSD